MIVVVNSTMYWFDLCFKFSICKVMSSCGAGNVVHKIGVRSMSCVIKSREVVLAAQEDIWGKRQEAVVFKSKHFAQGRLSRHLTSDVTGQWTAKFR